nr:ribonuclease H-like domain-containing protein [Tanacetum cinerariifolium]
MGYCTRRYGVGKTRGGGGFGLGGKIGKGREVEDGYGDVWGIGRVCPCETIRTNITPPKKNSLPRRKKWNLKVHNLVPLQSYPCSSKNGNSFKPVAETTTDHAGTSTTLILGLVTIEEKDKKKNDVKAKNMLLMALPKEHIMTFNQYKDAKTLFAAIETRFGRNEAIKKTQKTLLKQLYRNFSATGTKSLDSIFNKLQKLVIQLAVLGVIFSQEDLNLEFLRSLPSEWNTHVVVWRNKSDLDTMSLDDLYNNFKIVKKEVKGTTISTASPQVSSANLSDATVYMADDEAPTNMAFLSLLDSEVYTDNTCSKTCLKNHATLKTQYDELRVEFNKSKCNLADYKRGLASVEEQLVHYQTNESLLNENIAILKRDIKIQDFEIVVLKSKLEKISNEKDVLETKIEKFENASQSTDKLIGSQVTDNSKKCLGCVSYNAIPPPHTRSYRVKPIEVVTQKSSVKISAPVKENNGAPLIDDWESDEEDEVESPPEKERKTVKPGMDKVEVEIPKQNEKPARRPVKYDEMYRTQRPRGNQRNWNNLKSHQLVPKAMLTRTGLKPVNYVRPVNPKRNFQRRAAYNNINLFKKVNTAKEKVNTTRPNSAVLNAVKENKGKAVKALACWVWRHIKLDSTLIVLKKHTYIDARGRSKPEIFPISLTSKSLGEELKVVRLLEKEQSELMCDKKKNILFTDTECFVLSHDFKLADESDVLLKVPRKNNMYSVDMKNINKVLVVKPYFKTPYELFRGSTPALSFMRPFCCHVAILNTLDHLGKFDGKSDEGFFVGYSTNSKAFRVYNTKTRKSGVQTRRMTVTTDDQGFISAIYEEKTHKDLHTYLFACFLSQEEPKRITNALKDSSWVEAMQKNYCSFIYKSFGH